MAEPVAYLTFRIGFSALHDLRNPKLSDSENRAIFGKCFNLHGHDYYLEVTVQGQIDSDWGTICPRDWIQDQLQNGIVNKYQGTNLNAFFQITTGEVLVDGLFKEISNLLNPHKVARVKLQETPRNFFIKSLQSFEKFHL